MTGQPATRGFKAGAGKWRQLRGFIGYSIPQMATNLLNINPLVIYHIAASMHAQLQWHTYKQLKPTTACCPGHLAGADMDGRVSFQLSASSIPTVPTRAIHTTACHPHSILDSCL